MARLLTTGWETGTHDDAYGYSGYPDMETSSPRTGGYALRIRAADTYPLRSWTGVSELYMGFAFRPAAIDGTIHKIVYFRDGVTTVNQLRLSGSGYLQAYNGDGTTLLATGTQALAGGVWYYIQVHLKVADSSGDFEVKVDGATVLDIDYSGDTKPSTNTVITNVMLSGYQSGSTYRTAYDDLVVNDTSGSYNNSWTGNVKLYPIRPNAAGDSTQWTPNTGNNYAAVDEVPSTHNEYVYSTTVDNKDLYNFGTVTLPTGSTVKNLVVITNAYLDSGSGSIALGVKSSSSEDFGSDQALGTSLKPFEYAVPLDPATSAAWGQSGIDSVQAGMKCR